MEGEGGHVYKMGLNAARASCWTPSESALTVGKAHPAMSTPHPLREDDGVAPRWGHLIACRADFIDGRRRIQEALFRPPDDKTPHPPTRPRVGRQDRLPDPATTGHGNSSTSSCGGATPT